jgi:hypothetical protein
MGVVAYTPQLGDIGIVTIHGPGGGGIGFGEWLAGAGRNARWRHCFGVNGTAEQAPFGYGLPDVQVPSIVEAEPSGARMVALSQYDREPILWLRCPPQYGKAVAQALTSLIGTGYSWPTYDAVGLHRLHIPAPGLRAYIEKSNRLICSQLVDLAAQRGGWKIFDDGRWNGYVIPSDLAAVAEKQGVAA